MPSRSGKPGRNPAAIGLCLILATIAFACLAAASANASFYKMVLCAGNNGSNSFDVATNTRSPQNPDGIFSVENYCGPAPDPAGGSAFIRIAENQGSGQAGNTAYASASWTVPPWIEVVAGGGWTRQPGNFNDGWRARFWAEDFGGRGHNILMQGWGVAGGGIFQGATSAFTSHPWPFSGWGEYRRFIYELTCMRPAGCDRAGWNATDANTFVLILDDVSPSHVALTGTDAPFLGGHWVRGTQTASYSWSDIGSGIRFERLKIDGAERFAIDHIAGGQCNRDTSQANGEFARVFQPCPTAGNIGRAYTFDTATLPDGPHTVEVCTQDYGQWQGIAGTGGQSCDQRTIRTDNTAPGAPAGLVVNSANPERYLDRFGATFTLPPNHGSPIVKAHYSVLDANGKVVVPEKAVTGTDITAITGIEGRKEPAAYKLAVRLEDAVGFVGPASIAPIPHDRTPPAAPQDLAVTAPGTPRSIDGFDVRWRNILDAGSPIHAVHYRVLGGGGEVMLPTKTVAADNPQTIESLDTPSERGAYTLELWLSDAEGNVGAPVKAPLAYDCVRSEVGGGAGLTAGLGASGDASLLVLQGEGSTLRGKLQGLARPRSAPVCVFSRIVTDVDRQFLGIAMTDADGSYEFAVQAGPSRELVAVHRPDQRELSAQALLRTQVNPTFLLHRKVVRNKGFAIFKGAIPGPRNEGVVLVLQVKSGKAWRVFRRYRTRAGGGYVMRYRFTQTQSPTVYVMRAQVREQSGYPYEEGNSQARRLRVVPTVSSTRP